MFYLCTDLNPDQYRQYLLRPSAVTKPLFKGKKNFTKDYVKLWTTTNKQTKKRTEEGEIKIHFDSLGDFAAVKHTTLSASDCELARS